LDYAQGKIVFASEPVIGDVDGDGLNEVIFGTFDPHYGRNTPVDLWILGNDGSVKAKLPLPVDTNGIVAAPTLADLDGDGKLEIAAATMTGMIYVWDTPAPFDPARLPWPTERHDIQRTAFFANNHPNSDLTPLTLDKSVALTHNPARPGDPITYTIVVRNTSVTDTVGVHITDTLPAYVVGANLDTTRGVTGNSAVTITVLATVASNMPSGATIINTAFFSHTSGGGSDSASFTVSTLLPDLSTSTKRVNATTVQAGGLVTFTIVLSNTGLAAATVRYTDTLPAQVDRVSGALTGTASVGTGSLSAPMVIVARAKRNLVNGTVFNNTVAINDGVHPVFSIASPNVTVQSPDFSTSVRTVNKSVFEPGEYITYTLTLFNSGEMNATVRYTVTLATEVMSPTGALSGTVTASPESLLLPTVVVAQVRPGLANGVAFHAHVDINDGYHPVYTLDFPVTAIHAFYTYLPLVMRDYQSSPTSWAGDYQ
jgi:uncharacterized repeat protein (TIGR01451 family)